MRPPGSNHGATRSRNKTGRPTTKGSRPTPPRSQNVFDESTEHEAKEDDYNNALATLERLDAQRREAEEQEAQRLLELEAENRRREAARLKAQQDAREREAQRAREVARLKAQRDAQRQEAERRKARLEEERRAAERAREEEEEWRYVQRQREERERSRSSDSCLFGGCGEAERMFEEMQRRVQQGREASRRSTGRGTGRCSVGGDIVC